MASKNNISLLLVFILGSLSIVARAYFFADYYLSPDSKAYLSLAQNLLDGNGFYLANGGHKTFFSIWPVGYPVLIAVISLIFHVSVFWGSKLLNILLLFVILIFIQHIFKKNSYTYYYLLLWASYLEIFSFSWSEVPFVLGLLWFSYAVYCFISNGQTFSAVNMFVSSLFLFLIRYVGAFSILFVGILSVYCVAEKKLKQGLVALLVMLLGIAVVVSYLCNNFHETGYITGMARHAAVKSNLDLLVALLAAVFFELNIVLSGCGEFWMFVFSVIAQPVMMIFFTVKYLNVYTRTNCENSIFTKVCACVGIFYLVSIVVLRWFREFDEFGFRFLAPGTFLLIISLISHLRAKTNEEGFQVFSNFFISMSLLSYFINVPLEIFFKVVSG